MPKRNFVSQSCGRMVHNVWLGRGRTQPVMHSTSSASQLAVYKHRTFTSFFPQAAVFSPRTYLQYYATLAPVIRTLVPTIHTPYIHERNLKKGIF